MQAVVAATLARCRAESDWHIAAVSIEPTHTHLLLRYTKRELDRTIKWLKDRLTKAIHRETPHTGPVWCKGSWRSYIFADEVWHNTAAYINRHNERSGHGPNPYPFVEYVQP